MYLPQLSVALRESSSAAGTFRDRHQHGSGYHQNAGQCVYSLRKHCVAFPKEHLDAECPNARPDPTSLNWVIHVSNTFGSNGAAALLQAFEELDRSINVRKSASKKRPDSIVTGVMLGAWLDAID